MLKRTKRLEMSLPLSCQKAYSYAILDRPLLESKISTLSKNRRCYKKFLTKQVIKPKVESESPQNFGKKMQLSSSLCC